MKVSIIAVGTELLFGNTVNTNATYLSNHLNHMGFDVMYHFVVGDNPDRLRDKIDEAFNSTDIILLTGGLGPTQDDLTKEIVAEKMGAEMHVDEQVMRDLNDFFNERGIEMSENNLKQALMPNGAIPFYNESGTAPGFALEKNGKIAICLPGPPREMTWLFENGVRDYLAKLVDKRMYYKIVRTVGIGESDLETLLLPLINNQTDPTIATYVKDGEATFRVASQRDTVEEAKQAVEDMLFEVDKLVGNYIYSYDNEDLKTVVVKLLKEKGLKLSSAESCTGGKFAAAITDVSGASAVFDTSYVTYCNDSKINNIDVPAEMIEEFGVSSREVGLAMALGTKKRTGSDITIAITGNAGPDTYEGQKAGQAYIGYTYGEKSGTIDVEFFGRADRALIRNMFTLRMLRTVYYLLIGKL